MVLTVKDRLVIVNLYPQEADIITQVLIKDINKKVELTQEEMKEINLRLEGNKYLWDIKKGKDKEITFTEAELDLLKAQVNKLDKEKKITQEILPLCLKIREEKTDAVSK